MKKVIFALFLALAAFSAFAVTALHIPPLTYTYGQDVILRLEIQEGLETIAEVNLMYKVKGAADYMSEKMKPEAPGSIWFNGTIPARHIDDNEMEYYFEFKRINLDLQKYPEENNLLKPFALVPGGMKGKLDQGFVLLSTDEDFPQDEGYLLAVSYYGIADEIDVSSIKVWVGGRDVTPKAVITDNSLVYRDSRPELGLTKAVVTAVTKSGDEIHSETFITEVTGTGRGRPFEYWGNVSFASNIYDYNYKDSSVASMAEADNDYAGWLDLYGKYGILNLKTNLYLSSFEEKNLQPVNRYSFGIQIPHLEVVAGDHSPVISPLTMYNRNVRGLYGKVSSSFLGLEVSAGEMVRMTELEDDNDAPIGGTFKQEALGGRLRLGMEDGFTLGINLVRNRDIISSLDPDYFLVPGAVDTTFIVTPQDNAVVSVDAKLNIPEQNVVLGVEVAGSLLTRNTYDGALTSDEIAEYVENADFIDPEAIADLFVINKSMEPLLPGMANLAWTGYARTFFWNNYLNASYSVTGPAFNALSTHSQMNDTQSIVINDQFALGRYLMLAGGYSVSSDNYSGTADEMNKYTSWYVQTVLRLPRLPYLKAAYFNTDAENENNPDVQPAADFVPYTRNSHNLSVGLGYQVNQIRILPSQLDVTFRTGKDDSNTNDVLDYENFSNSLNISLSNKLLLVPLRTQFVFSLGNQEKDPAPNDITVDELKDNNFTLFAKADYSLLKDRLIPYFQYRLVNLTGDQQDQSFNYYTLGLEAFPIRDLSISTDLSKKYYTNQDNNLANNDTLTWRFLITQRF
jgi:hypothetical protein